MIPVGYKDGTIFQLLLKGAEAANVIEDWCYQDMRADIRIRRAKTKGCAVIETTDAIFASRTLRFHPDTKVNIKEP